MQAVLGPPEKGSGRRIEIFSRGESEDAWTLHASGRAALSARAGAAGTCLDVDGMKSSMAPQDVAAVYRARADAGISFGPTFRTLQALWTANGEAIGEVELPDTVDSNDIDFHPLLLDGCFQVLSAARHAAGGDDEGLI